MDYVNCGYFPFNDASRELQKKLGFTYFTEETFEHNGEKSPPLIMFCGTNKEKERIR